MTGSWIWTCGFKILRQAIFDVFDSRDSVVPDEFGPQKRNIEELDGLWGTN